MSTATAAISENRTLSATVRKRFGTKEGEFSLDVEFTALAGFNILFGPSGSGKTTLLDCISGLATPDAGTIEIGGESFFKSSSEIDRPISRRNVGYVFQNLALFPHLSVQQNVEYGVARLPRDQRRERATAMLRDFHIDHLAGRRPADLSGGERQRVALARSLVTDPTVLLLDEPLAALDSSTKSKIVDDLRRWNQAHQIPILYVTHSREEVLALGERVLVLDHGRIIADGTPHQVLSAPLQETVAQLAGFENIFDASVWLVHEDRGTITCRLPGKRPGTFVLLETPLVRAEAGSRLRVGIRAGDVLMAIAQPEGLSARNILPGHLLTLERRDMMILALVDCGIDMYVQLTLAARDALKLQVGQQVWLVIKTHSCHLMRR